MTSRSLLTAALLGAAMMSQSASALSCARPDLAQTVKQAQDSPKIYYVLVGRFISLSKPTLDPAYNPGGDVLPGDPYRPKPPMITKSYFEGVSLAPTRRNDSRLSNFPVDIETSCIGPWCSNAPDSNQELIAFVEARVGQSPILKISPCPSQTFQANPKQVHKLRECLAGGCSSDEPNWR